jgi:flagellar biosynthesis protein FlhF
MAIRKFVAPTTREAMMQVRRELGDDAVIIANRRIGNRIEILAAAPDAVEALVERSETRAAAPLREHVPASERTHGRAEARPKVEPFQDFVRRQMQTNVDAPVSQRATREVPARTDVAQATRSLGGTAGVAMYHDVAEFEQEEFAAPQPRQVERAPATTLPHSHRAHQIETPAHASDPAVFRRRPARVAATARAEAPAVTAPAAPRNAPAAPPVDILLEPQPAPQAAPQIVVAAIQPEPRFEREVAAPVATPVAAGHATVPTLPIRSQAAPIATAARLREASINAAAEMAAVMQPVRDAVPVEAAPPAPQPVVIAATPVAPPPSQPFATWSWQAQFVAPPAAPNEPQVAAVQAPVVQAPAQQPAAPMQVAQIQAAEPVQSVVENQLLAELHSMHDMLRQQIATLASKPAPEAIAPSAPAIRVITRLLTSGFSAEVARRIASHVPQNAEVAQAEGWLHEVLAHNIRCAEPVDGIVERAGRPATPGQIYALVGPTGVGKTTTVAKLAARFAVRHGTSALGLITLDAYRVAAPEQLRTYGRILGTPVHLAQDAAALRELLATMVHKRLVLIDTCGVSQRDERLSEMLDLLAGAGTGNRPVQRVLLMNSASHAETLEEAARAWRADECAGAILTKLDEATRIGGALDVSLRHRLTLLGLTNGQRVPEDWHGANSKLLAHLALKPAAHLFDLADEEGAALIQVQAGNAALGTAHA